MLRLLLCLVLLVTLSACSNAIVSALDSPIETPTDTLTDTPTPTETPTETPTPTSTPTPTGTPYNLILNNNFVQHTPVPGAAHAHIFPSWSQTNTRWMWSPKPNPCENSEAKLGQDNPPSGAVYGWLVGDEDWLWQEVSMPESHTGIVFSITELQHMQPNAGGVAELRIFGSNNGGQTWEVIYHRPFPEAPMNGPSNRSTWYTFIYTITPTSHTRYRLEFHGILMDVNDGWKFSCISLKRS